MDFIFNNLSLWEHNMLNIKIFILFTYLPEFFVKK